ncbi:single-stranded DNA-binding protein [Clostridium oryzae]|uniref:Single-stranded DNA-binding protein n=1 Tax=Clostridium oryzae TaxID=1450648 RepID=A0A1V4IYG7_9CLOT|nr:single-stranded DNA-binding protein [Clostridium oryzae]OPJ65091.1 single-stranded DNA-binding protein A [Clostridium oryzae]
MNRIILVGRLTKDPEQRMIEDKNKLMAKFTLAVDRGFKNAEGEREADFIPIVLWGKRAEVAMEFLQKGSLISICGRLNCRSYEDSQGIRRYVSEVIGESFQFIDNIKTENTAV